MNQSERLLIGIHTPGYKALRRNRFSIANQIYLISFTTMHRKPVFENNYEVANIFCKALNDSRLWPDATLLCWVLMPGHVHVLIQLGEAESLESLINRLKTNTARQVNFCLKRRGQFWANGFHDKAIKFEEEIVDVARYLLLNPIRAGLVRSIGMYPYWDAVWI
jgi:putative transposase